MYVADIARAIAGDFQGHECMNKVNVDGRDIASICRCVCVLFISRGPLNGNGKPRHLLGFRGWGEQLMVRVKIRVMGDLVIL